MAADEGERRLAAILAADVAGYSRLMADDDRATIRTLTDYRAVFSEHVASHKGRIVDTAGDSVLATFDSVVEAVEAAVEVQRALSARNEALADHRAMHFRIGINLGDIIIRDDGTAYGDGVNVAARLEGLAAAGGVMISQTAYDQVEGRLAVGLADAGAHDVKNIAKPVRAYRVLLDGEAPASSVEGSAAAKILRRPKVIAGLVAALAVVIGFAVWGITVRVEVPRMVTADGMPTDDPVLAMPTGLSVAVLPFDELTENPPHPHLAEGVTNEIVSNFTTFSNLFVFALDSTRPLKDSNATPAEVRKALGADYVVRGTVQQIDGSIRVTANLIDTDTGEQVWSKRYDSEIAAKQLLDVQDDIATQIAGELGSSDSGVEAQRIRSLTRNPPETMSAYDCVLMELNYWNIRTPEAHAETRDCLERAVEDEPQYARAWGSLAFLYYDEFMIGYNTRPDAEERALNAARRSVTLEPSATNTSTLARILHATGDHDQFRKHAKIALTLNNNDAGLLNTLAFGYAGLGDLEIADQLWKKALKLNPNPPADWYWTKFHIEIGRQNYEAALTAAEQLFVEDFYYSYSALVAAYIGLGRQKDAEQAQKKVLELRPDWTVEAARQEMIRFVPWPPLVDFYTDAARRSGMPETPPEPARPVIAVLPFDNMSDDPGQDYFADGITEDITTRLSYFTDLAVVARNSAFQYKGEAVDVRAAAEALGADYVVEGSVRRFNTRVRVTAQLLEANDGTHMWAESWDRDLSAGDIFDIQDEITNGIVGVIAGIHGVIARSAAAGVRHKPESLDSYDCVLLATGYERQPSPEAWQLARQCLEDVLAREPDYVDALSAYTLIAADGYAVGRALSDGEREHLLATALATGEHAIDLAPDDANSHRQLAYASFVGGDVESFRVHAERGLALNPNDANVMGDTGTLMVFSGAYDRGLELIEEAIARNPHHPDWWYLGVFTTHWMNGRNQEALTAIGKVDQPENFWVYLSRTVIFTELGDMEGAATARSVLESLYPGFTIATYRMEAAYWQPTPDYVERVAAVLRKAGVPEGAPD